MQFPTADKGLAMARMNAEKILQKTLKMYTIRNIVAC